MATPGKTRTDTVPFTRAGGAFPAIRFLDDLGAPTDRLLGDVGLTRSLFGNGDALVPMLPVYRFAERAARTEGIDDLGVQVGLRTSAFDIGSYGTRLRECVSVYDYVRTGIRLIGTVTTGERFWLAPEGGRLRLYQRLPGEREPGHAYADLFTLSVTVRMLREFLGGCWTPEEIHLHAVHQEVCPALEELAGGKVMRGRRHTSFVIQRDILETPIPGDPCRNRDAHRPGTGSATDLPADFVSSVHRLTESLVAAGDCRIEGAAEAAGMSIRSFQRRLTESGLTYRSALRDARVRIASGWLASTDRPVIDIAYALGYEEPANFTRAFRHRTGMSPIRYRRRCRGGANTVADDAAEAGE